MVIAVDSVVYNMAGDVNDRPNFLKSLVARHMLSGTKATLGETLMSGYTRGPAMRLKTFYNWSSKNQNYGKIGRPTGKLEIYGTIPANKVALEIEVPDGKTVSVSSAMVSYGDPEFWADRYMLNNYPELYGTAWDSDYFRETNEIRIDFETGPNVRFTPGNFDYEARYLYAYYAIIDDATGLEDTTKLLIYKLGSGNADLDNLVEEKADYGEFFPFIPVRIDGKFISSTFHADAREQTEKAYEKATSGDLKELIEELKKNDDLNDIDHAYVVFGVSLNTKENAARRYIYKFFESLQASQEGGADAWEEYLNAMKAYSRKLAAWETWDKTVKRKGQQPKKPIKPEPPTNSIRIKGIGDIASYYDVRIKWAYISDHTRKGRGKPGAKPGDVWFKAQTYVIGKDARQVKLPDGRYNSYYKDVKSTKLKLYWQRTKTEYTVLEVVGAQYINTIYKGKSVKIDPKEALNDSEESGFIIPMHYSTWRNMSMVDTTQMSMSCVYMVFNCYKERKRKWYESGIFRIFLVIVIAIASVVFTGGAGIGLLGAHMAVGSAFGLSGMSAAILGSVVNAMAALVLTTVLEKVTQSLGILGPLVGFLIGAMIGNVMSSLTSGGAFSFNWSSLLNVDNLLKLTSAVGNTITAGIQQDTLGIQEDWVDFQENASEQAKKIQQAFFEQFGYGAGAIDPTMLVEQPKNPFALETSSTFLTRTLMTGSEIAEMSRELLYDFPKYSLELPDAFS